MTLSVLEPGRRRRRYRFQRVAALSVLPLLALAAGLVVGARHGGGRHAAATPAARPATSVPTVRRAARPVHRRPLVVGPPLLRHGPGLASRAAIVVDAGSGRVIWGRRMHERRHIASTTKIMTALVALPRLAPTDIVTVDRSVPRVPLVKEGLRAGEQVRAWKLFYALLLYSGNDDALALAIAAGGSRPAFVQLMNAEARRLALHDSHFSGPSGVVDVDNYSSAWDLAALTRVALRNERFRTIVRTRRERVSWAAPTFSKIYLNKNLMLSRYRGAIGVKTGYTTKAGHCLVAAATRNGVTLIAVVLDSGDEYGDATRLLDLGFRVDRG